MSKERNQTNRLPLVVADAVAAIIVLDDGRYLLQQRDEKPEIWYPGCWGCFGGSVDPGETPLAALRRELREELEFDSQKADLFTRFDFDLGSLGVGKCYRNYYVVPMSTAEHSRLVLHEGRAVRAFDAAAELSAIRVAPYDAFAIFLHSSRGRIKSGSASQS
jgi:8-oxo-dGTP pyrophosphatase MutT (NUDIX family)